MNEEIDEKNEKEATRKSFESNNERKIEEKVQ